MRRTLSMSSLAPFMLNVIAIGRVASQYGTAGVEPGCARAYGFATERLGGILRGGQEKPALAGQVQCGVILDR